MSTKKKKTLLIPAMLDAHFPLIKYAFVSKKYRPVILGLHEGITDLGLKYTHNDICYPAIMIVGQMIKALQSGKYDPYETVILEPQAGDACRGSNYIPLIRKALDQAGFSMVPIISLNVTGLNKDEQLPITKELLFRAVAGAYYGDLLMILKNQILPYEVRKGETQHLYEKWIRVLGTQIRSESVITPRRIKSNFRKIVASFAKIKRKDKDLKKIGIIGELYIKYCHLGNWDIEKYLLDQGCEYYINGLTWYALYYVDTHMLSEGGVGKSGMAAKGYELMFKWFLDLQRSMVEAIRDEGFYVMDAYDVFKEKAKGYVTFQCSTGDGWLIGAEFVNHVMNGYDRVICGQPFGCLPSHVCGRGLYPAIRRKFPQAQYISVDFDASGTDALIKSRIRMLLSF